VSARRVAALAVLALVATACGSTTDSSAPRLPTPHGKSIRIGVTRLPRERPRNVEFLRLDPHRALAMFRRGELDEAPVPLGDIQAVLRDPQLRPAVRITPLNAIDTVVLQHGGVLDTLPDLRRAYSDTADRADYQALLPELEAPPAENLGPPRHPNARAAAVAFSRARKQIEKLPRVAVRFVEPSDPELAYGLNVLVGAWRDLGLGAYVTKGRADATFQRVSPGDQPAQRVIPIAWAVDARLVSPRVRGWHENARGIVDYSRIKLRDRRQRP
jgi:hypothetical protein